MFYILKLLFAALVTTAITGRIARPAFRDLLTAEAYQRAWTLVLAALAIAYVCHWPAVYMVAVAVLGLVASTAIGTGVRARIAAFFLLLLVLPPITLAVDGFGGISHIIELNHLRVLSLLLLGGAAVTLTGQRRPPAVAGQIGLDLAVLVYPLMKIAMGASLLTGTAVARQLVEVMLELLLPYYVLSRGLRTGADLRFVLAHLAIGVVAVAAIAAVEAMMQHNLFSGLQTWYQVKWQLTYALGRGGLLRVQASMPQPILFAYVIVYGMAIWLYLQGRAWRRPASLAVLALLSLVLISTWSRGPWLGGLSLFAAWFAMNRMSASLFRGTLVALAAFAAALVASGLAELMFDAVKAVFGDSSASDSSIDYRQQILETALALIRQSPWWGVPDYMAYMQHLRQGEGIVDIVNTYIRTALDTGLVGLAIYLAPFVLGAHALLSAWSDEQRRPAATRDAFAPAFVALIVATLVTLATSSSWYNMPMLLMMLVGLALAWLRMSPEERAATDEQAQPPTSQAALGPRWRPQVHQAPQR